MEYSKKKGEREEVKNSNRERIKELAKELATLTDSLMKRKKENNKEKKPQHKKKNHKGYHNNKK